MRELEDEIAKLKQGDSIFKENINTEEIKSAIFELNQEKSAIKKECSKYKSECMKLRKDVLPQIETLKLKLSKTEEKLEEKCKQAKQYTNEIINVLSSHSPPLITKAKQLLENLRNIFTNEVITAENKKIDTGIQKIPGISENKNKYEAKIEEMKKSIDTMKYGMKELEKLYEGELEKKENEKIIVEKELKIKIQGLQKDLFQYKTEIQKIIDKKEGVENENKELKEKMAQLIEYLQNNQPSEQQRKASNEENNCNDNPEEKSINIDEILMVKAQDPTYSWKSIETFCHHSNNSKVGNPEGSIEES